METFTLEVSVEEWKRIQSYRENPSENLLQRENEKLKKEIVENQEKIDESKKYRNQLKKMIEIRRLQLKIYESLEKDEEFDEKYDKYFEVDM
tara:strand:+ start:64 stop:339 length:276 start_codon:yes stop_codon:yes gene_type:complete